MLPPKYKMFIDENMLIRVTDNYNKTYTGKIYKTDIVLREDETTTRTHCCSYPKIDAILNKTVNLAVLRCG